MNIVHSKDGTTISYDRIGKGPAVILVDGALCWRASGPNGPLAALLAEHFTVFTYDRRGRGDSGDTQPFAIEREIEDLEAVIDAAGGSAFVYGISSGAALALEATVKLGSKVNQLALFEAPFVVDNSRPPVPDDFLAHLKKLVAENRRGAAVKLFMTKGVNLPAVMVFMMQLMPAWSKLKSVAHTLPYDVAFVEANQHGNPLSTTRWTAVTLPTLVMDGGKSPAWMRHAMKSLAETLPNTQYQTLERQMHIVKPEAMAPVLVDFFQG